MGIEKQYDSGDTAKKYSEASIENLEKDAGRRFIYEQISALSRTSRLLDVGCGGGIDLSAYSKMGFTNLAGIDSSRKFVDEAKETLKDTAELKEGTFECIPYEDGSFDVVTSRFALHYSKDIKKSLKEVARVLKSGGKFIAIVSNPVADAEEQKDTDGNITITLFNGKVTITFPQHSLDEYFSEEFLNDFTLETKYEYCGNEQDRAVSGLPNALAISAKRK
ncbi:class I SAM-dependent methyltransferase [Candidatus Nomurabacteria bacterium]|nr:class I SAM-dependent methyltransferase [Candidatus Nomurabacteria bacterium]